MNTLIGKDPLFRQLLNTADLVAATQASVLVLGESGSGKEVLARHIHDRSPRARQPFIAVNCASLPEHLVESELFGHRKGAFTGASQDRIGLIRAAEGGTLFLDEVGELPLALQAKLLRFLENGEILPLGHNRPQHVDARVIAATNCRLEEMVLEGRFRTDLFYRLQVVPMTLPPLRERMGDIADLAAHFMAEAARRHGLRSLSFAPDAMAILKSHPWPGNIRELKNLCERLTILCQAMPTAIGAGNLPLELQQKAPASERAAADPLDLSSNERTLILQALEQARGNKSQAAKLLGITRYTLLYRIRKHFPEDYPNVSF